MKIKKASALGFCFGVRRAIEVVESGAEEYGPIDSLGSVVHNPVVVDKLDNKGVRVVQGLEQVESGTIAVTAHGRGPQIVDEASRRGLRLIDATCPIVRKSQKAAQKLVHDGFKLIIYGEEDHPEVRGVLAWTDGKGVAILDPESSIDIPRRKVALLSQTTKSEESFAEFVARFVAHNIGRFNELRIINTTCPETDERYHAARELAAESDLILVVGGRNSANTRKLAQTCAGAGVETHHIETAGEIEPAWLQGREVVGVTAGASTPDESIDEVVRRLRELDRQGKSERRRRRPQPAAAAT
ncbi:MAG: 4-hydroxy-3-methylbut-2-enyl diphosphate reductase [Chloroflexi bacterium]|nr:4-hydroxy-3-methylbut-2-enyl diphosphate reductase [Chloroflexota bacterium]